MRLILTITLLALSLHVAASDICVATKKCLVSNMACSYTIENCPQVGKKSSSMGDLIDLFSESDYSFAGQFFGSEYVLFTERQNLRSVYCLVVKREETTKLLGYYEAVCSNFDYVHLIIPTLSMLDHYMDAHGMEFTLRFNGGRLYQYYR